HRDGRGRGGPRALPGLAGGRRFRKDRPMTTRKKKKTGRAARQLAKRRSPARGAAFLARDLMTRTPITVRADMRVGALCDLLQEKNINGAPVVDSEGRLVGVVTQ